MVTGDASRTVVVGSGPSVLLSEMGERIDAHGEIVRFKGFEDGGADVAPHVGTRVTHLCFNTNRDTLKDLVAKMDAGEFDGMRGYYMTYTSQQALRRGMRMVRPRIGRPEVCNYSRVWRRVRRYAYDRRLDFNTRKTLTSGMIVIAHLCLVGGRRGVRVHGFDALSEDGVTEEHYYDRGERINIGRLHDLEGEGRLLSRMRGEGIIETLAQ